MNHNEYRANLPLLVYGELNKSEEKALKLHMEQCADCKQEFDQLEKLYSTIETADVPKASESLLQEARMELRAALRIEKSKHAWKDIWTERLQGWLPIFRLSFTVTTALAVLVLAEPLTPWKLAGLAAAFAAVWLLLGGEGGSAQAQGAPRRALG